MKQHTLSQKTRNALAEYAKLSGDTASQKLLENKLTSYYTAFKESLVKATQLLHIKQPAHLEILENEEAFMEALSKAQTVAEMCGFPPHELSLWYTQAYEYFQKEDYENARDCFLLLVTLCPIMNDFWIALSLSFFYLHDEDSAKWAATQAILVAPDDLEGYLCLAKIYSEQQEYALALDLLEKATSKSSDPEFQKGIACAKQEVVAHKNKRGV